MNGPSFIQLPIQIEPRHYRHLLIYFIAVLHDEPSITFFRIDNDHVRLTPDEMQSIYDLMDQIGHAIAEDDIPLFWTLFWNEHRA